MNEELKAKLELALDAPDGHRHSFLDGSCVKCGAEETGTLRKQIAILTAEVAPAIHTPDDRAIVEQIQEWRDLFETASDAEQFAARLNAVGLLISIDQALRDRLGLPHRHSVRKP